MESFDMAQILYLEDNPESQAIFKGLIEPRHQVVVADSIHSAMDLIRTRHFHTIVLDVELPDGESFSLIPKIKESALNRYTPVVLLSCRDSLNSRVIGLTLGADDFIAKPFQPLELIARIEARLRGGKAQTRNQVIDFWPFRVDLAHMTISIFEDEEERVFDLTLIEFKILKYFLENENKVVTRDEVAGSVWGKNINLGPRTIDTHIYSIRKQLGPYSNYIRSISKVGYIFEK